MTDRDSFLSVCIPTWNGSATVVRTLQAVLRQKEVDLEIIVGDDDSQDDTVGAVRSVHDSRIQLHAFADRAGIVGNWNRTLRLARGEYVVLLGQDDEVDPGWAASLLALLRTHPEADLAFCRRRFVFDSEESERTLGDFFTRRYPEMLSGFYSRIGEVVSTRVMVQEAMRFDFEINLIGEPAFTMFRRSHQALEEGYDPSMSQMMDWEFSTRFFAQGPILHCPKVLGTYHIRASGVSVDNAKNFHRHQQEYAHLLELLLKRFRSVLDDKQKSALCARLA